MRLHDLAREEGLKIGPVAAHVLENVVDTQRSTTIETQQ